MNELRIPWRVGGRPGAGTGDMSFIGDQQHGEGGSNAVQLSRRFQRRPVGRYMLLATGRATIAAATISL